MKAELHSDEPGQIRFRKPVPHWTIERPVAKNASQFNLRAIFIVLTALCIVFSITTALGVEPIQLGIAVSSLSAVVIFAIVLIETFAFISGRR